MSRPAKRLGGGVQDLFGTGDVDSFGPAPGEVIDADFFDSEHHQMGRPVPESPGIPSEAFKVPQAPEPVWTTRPTPEKPARPGLVYLFIAVLVLAGGAVAAWQFGLLDELIDSLALGSSEPAEPSRAAVPLADPKATRAQRGRRGRDGCRRRVRKPSSRRAGGRPRRTP